ncbi:hypothetical protein BTO30_12545 [Domibacillus antri]|uniref:Uncharacterized protein n=2 Tax=Domibacillus antri TaxID=1714264 RepID=A0A1Q8Q3M3_9BACI|nr:hypothetical protein BTO30_12545 [Domibacillus antri]
MLNHLPEVFRDSPDFKEMCRVEGKIWDRLEQHIADVLNNAFIDRATWGLAKMEDEFRIPVDLKKSLVQRRGVIKAKKRGWGKLSDTLIKSIVESFQNGTVDVQPIKGQSKFLITFKDVIGTPPSIEDIEEAVRKVIPSHRVIQYQYRYLIIEEVEAMTLSQLNATPLNKFTPGGA